MCIEHIPKASDYELSPEKKAKLDSIKERLTNAFNTLDNSHQKASLIEKNMRSLLQKFGN